MKPLLADDSFAATTALAADGVVLVTSLIVLGVIILGWELGARWITAIVASDHELEDRRSDEFMDSL